MVTDWKKIFVQVASQSYSRIKSSGASMSIIRLMASCQHSVLMPSFKMLPRQTSIMKLPVHWLKMSSLATMLRFLLMDRLGLGKPLPWKVSQLQRRRGSFRILLLKYLRVFRKLHPIHGKNSVSHCNCIFG